MKRRDWLKGFGILMASQGMTACSGQSEKRLQIELLERAVPIQVIEQFQRASGIKVQVKQQQQLQQLFDRLSREHSQTPAPKSPLSRSMEWWKAMHPTRTPHLVALGDAWLADAIQQQLIHPLAIEKLPTWSTLPQIWQRSVRRDRQGNLSSQGEIWAAPYRWGSTVIAYNQEPFQQLGWEPQDWSDLWRLELKQRISLLDQPREVIGLVLKKLGHSYNTIDLATVPQLQSELRSLQDQVKFYSSDTYLQPLLLADTWVAVGWSTDVLAVMKNYPKIKAVIPQSGTALWSELWVCPVGSSSVGAIATPSSPAIQWIDYCWQPQASIEFAVRSQASTVLMSQTELPEKLQAVLTPEAKLFERCELLQPLSPTARSQYQTLWQEIRQR
jgi:putative spermidine/putrescine transport system substrate-binding protein